MAADLNRVTLVGRPTRDPEIRHTGGGDPIASIRLAVSSRKRDENGDWSDTPNYFDVTVFGRQAQAVADYVTKGRRIGVDGRLSWREWQAQDGTRRQSVEVVANDVYFLDSRQDGDGGGSSGAPADDLAPASAAPPSTAPAADDDIPF